MGDDIIESDIGFVTFRIINDGKSIYLIDVYIKPEYRKSYKAGKLIYQAIQYGKSFGCTEIWATVVPSAKNSMRSMKLLLDHGGIVHSSLQDMIILKKDLV